MISTLLSSYRRCRRCLSPIFSKRNIVPPIGQLPRGWRAGEPLRRIIRMLDMPKLTRIDPRPFVNGVPLSCLKIPTDIFGFPNLVYPSVESFGLQKLQLQCDTTWAYIDLDAVFQSFPALRSLTLGSCHTIMYSRRTKDSLPSDLRYLRLECGDEVTEEDCLGLLYYLVKLFRRSQASLSEVEVVPPYERVFSNVCKRFPCARWVTDRSILDEEADDDDETDDEEDDAVD